MTDNASHSLDTTTRLSLKRSGISSGCLLLVGFSFTWLSVLLMISELHNAKEEIVSTQKLVIQLKNEIAELKNNQLASRRKLVQFESEITGASRQTQSSWTNATFELRKQIERLRRDAEPVWPAIKLLEHGVQKANNEFTPFWPMPPKECKKYPRQTEPKLLGDHVREQMLYGPMVKMALIADKVRVREVVQSFDCPNLQIVPVLGVWDATNISTIDLGKVPSSYALKANHGAGFVVIVKDNIVKVVHTKMTNRAHAVKQMHALLEKPVEASVVIAYFKHALKKMYRDCHEPHYAFIDKLVFAEPLISSEDGTLPMDYKLFSTKGRFLLAKLFLDRFGHMRQGYVDRDFNVLSDYQAAKKRWMAEESDIEAVKPKSWNEMVHVAECLTWNLYKWGGIRLVRVDLYDWQGRITLGELTLTPAGGGPSVFENDHELMLGAQFDM